MSGGIRVIGATERDAVAELVNVAVGRAAASLSDLVGGEVRLSVPFVDFCDPEQAAARLDRETGGADTVAVRQHFEGRMHGDILLIFPGKRSLDLVRSMLGDQVPLDQLTDLEQDALVEVGNIILNACLGSIANQLGLSLESSLPICVRGRASRILEAGAEHGGDLELVLFLHVDFDVLDQDISGYLAFIMDIVSAGHFIEAVTAYVSSRLGG